MLLEFNLFIFSLQGLWDSTNQAFIHVKRMGVDINPFQSAKSRRFFKGVNIELLELWSLCTEYTRDLSWHPFKVVVDEVGNAKVHTHSTNFAPSP